MTRVVQVTLLVLLGVGVSIAAPQQLVSLEDVTGTTTARPLVSGQTTNQLGYPPPPHGPQGGLVSLEDVTGHVQHHPRPRPPHPPHPLHHDAYYSQYSPCSAPNAYQQSNPAGNLVSLTDVVGLPERPLSRTRRALVPLEDVAGPAAARYPAVGPPAYTGPHYNWYYNHYNRPRPYYNSYYYNLVPCIGLWCL